MKTYKMKRVVVGILLVMLTLGFCVVGTGAASADQKVGPDQMGQGGQMTRELLKSENMYEFIAGIATLGCWTMADIQIPT